MITVQARGTAGPAEPFVPMTINRRDLRAHDVLIDIVYSGICHSDIHHARSEWGKTHYPIVPGHEIAGVVSAIGPNVTRFAVGDRVGVGCMVDSCRECEHCRAGLEQYCHEGHVLTYNAIGRDGELTLGGYSERIVVDESYVVRIPAAIALDRAAPLMCAGITVYSPLRHWSAGPGRRVAIVGLGGLGHLAVQISRALGAHTTVLDLSASKQDDAMRLGADEFCVSSDEGALDALMTSFDLVISTATANVDVNRFLDLLALDGTLVNVGVPDGQLSLSPFSLFHYRRSMAGTLIGGIAETQEMLDFCADRGIAADVEVIGADEIDAAYDRVVSGRIRFRFVIDTSTLAPG
jgi:uncharacterized zinc-type alcohol dehydrogenase-like protein